MAHSNEQELLTSEILVPIGQNAFRIPEQKITGMLASKGSQYARDLMVVGIAGNGWIEGVSPEELSDRAGASIFAKAVAAGVTSENECPMAWVARQWGDPVNYNTMRSQFWRVTRDLIDRMGVADTSRADWSSHIVWSNLYKVFPNDGKNPSTTLRHVQQAGCTKLLREELRMYRPRNVVFLTGLDLAEPFLKDIPIEHRVTSGTYVRARGLWEGADGAKGNVVIAVHPRGKVESEWVREVMESFSVRSERD